jgi:uncharacterized membrane protein
MATATTARSRRKRLPADAGPRNSGAGSRAAKAVTKPAKATAGSAKTVKRAAKTAKGVRKVQRALPGKAGSLVTLWRLAKLGRRLAKQKLPAAAEMLRDRSGLTREIADFAGDHGLQDLVEQLRRVPVQVSLDVAVPVAVAYDEWMQLDFLPEGGHRVQAIKRRGRQLLGEIRGSSGTHRWKAEIRDARRDESFAWRSTRGSDVAGLVTFHRLGDRLTRLELNLDIVPVNMSEAIALTLRLSDRMALADLRRFKLRVETMSPDAYPARAHHANRRARKPDRRANRRAQQGNARARKSRKQSKEE